MKKYLVTLIREVEYRAEVEVEADGLEEAEEKAVAIADEPKSGDGGGYWVEGDCLNQTAKFKTLSKG